MTTEYNARILVLCLVRKREMRSNVTLAVRNGIFVRHLERERERERESKVTVEVLNSIFILSFGFFTAKHVALCFTWGCK